MLLGINKLPSVKPACPDMNLIVRGQFKIPFTYKSDPSCYVSSHLSSDISHP